MRKDSKILKRKLRQEKKCQKLSALLEITKLNDEDRLKKLSLTTNGEPAANRICTEDPSKTQATGPAGKPLLHNEEYLKLKQQLKERKALLDNYPKFRLREIGQRATLDIESGDRIPIYFPDLQHLLLYSQIGHHSPYAPSRWCQLEKFNRLEHTNVLIVENLSMYHYQSYETLFPYLHSNFAHKLELITPEAYHSDLVQELVTVPLTGQQTRNIISEHGSLENAVRDSSNVFDRVNCAFPVKEKVKRSNSGSIPETDRFSRTDLLLSGWQMIEENFPMPIDGLTTTKYAEYVMTKDVYKDVTPFSPMFAVDCEMCLTSAGSELTRISIVDEECTPIYDELVKPKHPIKDYLTKYSGITPNMMKHAQKELKDVHEDLRRMLPPDAILVGQSLGGDLHAMKMMHPYVIDTSVIYNITGDRKRKTKLQTLAREFLNLRIQDSRKGHCSTEDSGACLRLVKHKLLHDISYGDAVMTNIATQINCYTALGNPNYGTSFLKHITKVDRTAQVVSLEGIIEKYRHYTYKSHESVIEKISCVAENNNDLVIDRLCKRAENFSFNIGHVAFTDDDLNSKVQDTCRKVNEWAERIQKSSKEPGLCVVVLGGHHVWRNGCCFISMSKCSHKNLL
uniref:Exonuclease domain-containing protein n=1 Tax=Photinus pyralis TaxID=7054 RepID=A0A1Y1N5B8_PHOPY